MAMHNHQWRQPSRRGFLAGAGALALGLGPLGCASDRAGADRGDPFTLGVASGDPWPDGVVLWTRLAPRPLAGDGGMAPVPADVRWEVADDDGFRRVVARGVARALPDDAHSVHVEVAGLAPARTYFYRFMALGAVSETGRTRTAPAPGAMPAELRLAQVGCQDYESGFYTAYRHLAGEALDLVIHTGDYIYEKAARLGSRAPVRHHPAETCIRLDQYRRRYALYKLDPDLRAAHAAHPFAAVFDDHEVANDWAGDHAGDGGSDADFPARRAAAFRAYWEHMPLRARARPRGPHMRLHRALQYGALARISLCDTRQYRGDQPCGGRRSASCGADRDPAATVLGRAQEAWLAASMARAAPGWNVIAQQVPLARIDRGRGGGPAVFAMDKWDGYRVAQARLLRAIAATKGGAGTVVMSGDIHHHLCAELRADFDRPRGAAVATEFVNSSIASRGDGREPGPRLADLLARNPHIRFVLDRRGYCRHVVRPASWHCDFRVVETVSRPGAPIATRRSFRIDAGSAAPQPA